MVALASCQEIGKTDRREPTVRRYAILVFVLTSIGLYGQSDLIETQGKAVAGSVRELPLVEQFKNQVRGILQSNRNPAPAAIALAVSEKYKNDQATQGFAADRLRDFLENPGTVGIAAIKTVPLQNKGNAPITAPALQAAMQTTRRHQIDQDPFETRHAKQDLK